MTDQGRSDCLARVQELLLQMGLEDAWPLPEALTDHTIREVAEGDVLPGLVKQALVALAEDGRVIIYRGLWSDDDPPPVPRDEALALAADSRWYAYPETDDPLEERVWFANAELKGASRLRVVSLSHTQCQYILAADFVPADIQTDVAQAAQAFNATPRPRTVDFEITHDRAEFFRGACTTRLAQAGFDEAYETTEEGATLEDLIDAFFSGGESQ